MAIAFTVTLALVTPMLAASAHASPSNDLAGERQKAAQLEAEIEANGNQVSVLDEKYVEAQLAIKNASARIAADQAALVAKEHEAAATRARLAERAVEIYMGAGSSTPLSALDATSADELGTRSTYAGAAAAQDTNLLDQVKVATEQLGLQSKALAKARAAAVAQSNQLAQARDEITKATARQEQLLGEVKGHIAELVQADALAQQRAQEAAARAALAREQAQANQQNSQSDNSNSGPPPGPPDTTGPNVPAPNPQAQVAVDTAKAQLGKPYVYAGAGPDVFDCSGLTMYAWAAAGVSLPHSAEAQYDMLPHVALDQTVPGDLVFFGDPIHHVGMVVGGGEMIEAPYTGADVRYHSMYRPDFAGAARP